LKIAVGSDHGGFRQKQKIVSLLSKMGYQMIDLGCHSEDSVDYPDYAKKVAHAVSQHIVDRAVLVCGTGIGMSIAANKFPGVRAAVCWNPQIASLAAEHNDANILCLSGRFLSAGTAAKMVKAWLTTPFARGRHLKRINKIKKMEKTLSSRSC
jgi:ribose 5-phosphate isomerase B